LGYNPLTVLIELLELVLNVGRGFFKSVFPGVGGKTDGKGACPYLFSKDILQQECTLPGFI
jgi:hypothetical protein